MKVTSLYLYPVKSCGGIAVGELSLGRRGPLGDRHWMVVDGQGTFLTQRSHPRMALIGLSLDGTKLRAEAEGSGSVEWDLFAEHGGGTPFTSKVWKDPVTVVAARREVNEWFSLFLGLECRVARLADGETRKHVKQGWEWEASFPDSAPILLVNDASLADLNSRLAERLPMDRFRPNVVVAGEAAYVEDSWREITIGEVSFPFLYACTRCTITTTDQKTAKRGIEPLRTLATYRRVADGIAFGVRMVNRGAGTLRLGDEVRVVL